MGARQRNENKLLARYRYLALWPIRINIAITELKSFLSLANGGEGVSFNSIKRIPFSAFDLKILQDFSLFINSSPYFSHILYYFYFFTYDMSPL